MSTYDTYAERLDPTPRLRQRYGRPVEEGKATVADAIRFCEERDLDPSQIRLGHNYVTWDGIETPDEIQSRIDWARKSRTDHVAAIRRMHDEYDRRGLYDAAPKELDMTERQAQDETTDGAA